METISLDQQICNEKCYLENFAKKFTQDVEDANDLVQDTILKAFRYYHLYQKGTNLRGWLYTIMKNTFINQCRRNTRVRAVMEITPDLSSYQMYQTATRNNGENKFVMEDIQKALANLEPEHYTPFLKYFEGYKYHEIADELGIPIGTVKTRIHAARRSLKAQLKMHVA